MATLTVEIPEEVAARFSTWTRSRPTLWHFST